MDIAFSHTASWQSEEHSRLLHTAQQTISTLQLQLDDKNQRLNHYQSMIERQQQQHRLRTKQYDTQVSELNAQIKHLTESNINTLQHAFQTLEHNDQQQRADVLPHERLVSMQEHHHIVVQKDADLQNLTAQNHTLTEQLSTLQLHLNERDTVIGEYLVEREKLVQDNKSYQETQKTYERELELQLKSVQQQYEQCSKLLTERDNQIQQLKATVNAIQAASAEPTQTAEELGSDVPTLQTQVQILQRQLHQSNAALNGLQAHSTATASAPAAESSAGNNKKHLEKAAALEAQVIALQQQLQQQQSSTAAAQRQEILLRKRVKDLQQKHTDVVAKLQTEVDTHKTAATAAQSAPVVRSDSNTADAHSKWQADKQLQTRVLVLKKQVTTLQQEKEQLLKQTTQPQSSQPSQVKSSTTAAQHQPMSAAQLLDVYTLQQQLSDAQQQVTELQYTVNVTDKALSMQLTESNRQLQQRIERLQQQLQVIESLQPHDTHLPPQMYADADANELYDRIGELETHLIQAQCDKLDLQYSAEMVTVRDQQSQQRVAQLQQMLHLVVDKLRAVTSNAKENQNPNQPTAEELDAFFTHVFGDAKPTYCTSAAAIVKQQKSGQIIAALKTIIEQLYSELQQQQSLSSAKPTYSHQQYLNVMKQNKALQSKLTLLQSNAKPAGTTDLTTATISAATTDTQLQRLQSLHEQTSKSLKREISTNSTLHKKLETLQEQLDLQLLNNNAAASDKPTDAQTKALTTQVTQLQERNGAQSNEIKQQREVIKKMKVQMLQMNELLEKVQKQHADELDQLRQRGGQQSNGHSAPAHTASPPHAIDADMDHLLTQLAALQRTNDRLTAENDNLRTELSAFDVNFFEEVEDLKYRYNTTFKQLKAVEQENRDWQRKFMAIGGRDEM